MPEAAPVWVVDDDRAVRFVLATALREAGYEVTGFESAADVLATLDRGDTVLVPNPSYPIHIYGAIIAGADIRSVRMDGGVDFYAELERAVRETQPKPKMMILGFPSNPTA
ncbi:MAG TPA: aminotransferase class I/II-fold pyridoxal phosphate-dependent enzyme, partial [Luteimonas sp.]|nr:aminotransferase class I/II-fold pyridoxal phosphate-dependent enzyme [Luteimonas sp.]